MVATLPARYEQPILAPFSVENELERRLERYAERLSADLARVPAEPAPRATYLDGLSSRLLGASIVFRSLGRELGDYLMRAAESDHADPVERLRA